MNFHRGVVTPSRPIDFDEDVDFSTFDFEKHKPSLQGIPFCHAEGEFYLEDDGEVHVDMRVQAKVLLRDASTLEDFLADVDYDDCFALLRKFDPDGEGYIFEENRIELRDVVFCSLHSLLPSCPHKGEDINPIAEDDPNS